MERRAQSRSRSFWAGWRAPTTPPRRCFERRWPLGAGLNLGHGLDRRLRGVACGRSDAGYTATAARARRALMPYQLFLKLAGQNIGGPLGYAGSEPDDGSADSTPTLGIAPASLDPNSQTNVPARSKFRYRHAHHNTRSR